MSRYTYAMEYEDLSERCHAELYARNAVRYSIGLARIAKWESKNAVFAMLEVIENQD
jgi:hypothetical protein